MFFDTVAVIAEKADVPPSTLIRFASEFGFSGFNEMKQIFRENLMEKPLITRKDFNFHIKLLNQKVKNHQKIF